MVRKTWLNLRTRGVAFHLTEGVGVTVPPFRKDEMPLARCSDASLTRTLRRAEEVSEDRKVSTEIAYFGCADPYPFRLYFE
mgnify:CR=1 FL=1